MDKLAGMETFVRVVEGGSFAAAALATGVSPTMVAKQVRAIEERLGARLLHRTTRRHQLTEVGQLYLERCRAALAGVALAEASATELQRAPRGPLAIVAPVGFGSRVLAPALAGWIATHPEVSVELTLDDRPEARIAKDCELGIVIGDVRDTALVARPLRPYRRVLAAAPRYLATHGTPDHPDELAQHSCLAIRYWRHADSWHLVGPAGEACVVPVAGRFTANEGGALRSAAAAGAGIVLQPEDALADDFASGRLLPVLPAWSFRPTPMHLVYASDRRPTAKLRSAIDFLVGRFGV
ncbi:LysR family transcriptional regulator [Roseateles sp. BYS78W]|uniref:LysR family transcriptional regulator n=1 Tax=Pelomonas candidula TaxID=3299025 RepID=A0ABW7H9X2_9BURK